MPRNTRNNKQRKKQTVIPETWKRQAPHSPTTLPFNPSAQNKSETLLHSVIELQPSSTIAHAKNKSTQSRWKAVSKNKQTTRATAAFEQPTNKCIQPRLHYFNLSNEAIGNDITSETDYDTILFHNINGIKDESNWAQIITTMKENRINVFGFAEINKSMDNFFNKSMDL
jgi:hypothetical protein